MRSRTFATLVVTLAVGAGSLILAPSATAAAPTVAAPAVQQTSVVAFGHGHGHGSGWWGGWGGGWGGWGCSCSCTPKPPANPCTPKPVDPCNPGGGDGGLGRYY